MPVYTIDLALHAACHDYADLIAALRDIGARPVLGRRWLIETDRDVGAPTAALLRRCAPGDALFVVEQSRGMSGGPEGRVTSGATASGSRPALPRSRPAAPSG